MQEAPVDRRYIDAIKKAWDSIKTRDPHALAASSGGSLKGSILSLAHLTREISVDLASGDIRWADGSDMKGDFKVVLLHYLENADGRLDGQVMSYREFEGGNLYYSVFQGRAIIPLVKNIADKPELLQAAGEKLGGKQVKRGDASIDFLFFPYLLVNVTVWKGDDEVPSSANIVFDSATKRILPAEDLAHLAADLVHEIIKVIK